MAAKKNPKTRSKKRGAKSKTTKERAISQLRCVIDPHTNISVYDMGLISELKIGADRVTLTFRPTSPFCPMAMPLARSIKGAIHDLDGVDEVVVTVVGHYQEDYINKALEAGLG